MLLHCVRSPLAVDFPSNKQLSPTNSCSRKFSITHCTNYSLRPTSMGLGLFISCIAQVLPPSIDRDHSGLVLSQPSLPSSRAQRLHGWWDLKWQRSYRKLASKNMQACTKLDKNLRHSEHRYYTLLQWYKYLCSERVSWVLLISEATLSLAKGAGLLLGWSLVPNYTLGTGECCHTTMHARISMVSQNVAISDSWRA